MSKPFCGSTFGAGPYSSLLQWSSLFKEQYFLVFFESENVTWFFVVIYSINDIDRFIDWLIIKPNYDEPSILIYSQNLIIARKRHALDNNE